MMEPLRATVAFGFLSLRRQAASRKLWFAATLLGMLMLLVCLVGLYHTWSAREFTGPVVLALISLFYLPIVCLLFGTAPLGELREDRLLGYLLCRPLPRPLLYAAQVTASLPLALGFTLGGFWLLCQAVVHFGRPELAEAFERFAPALFYGSLAYTALFHLAAALWKHATLIAFAYVFFVEVFVGNIPGFLKQGSVSFYVRSMLIDAAGEWAQRPPQAIFQPLEPAAASLALIVASGVLLVTGMWVFSRKEYADAL